MSKIRACGLAAVVVCGALAASSAPASAEPPQPPDRMTWVQSTSPVGYVLNSVQNLLGTR
jgi:ABC-type glycerol-3-phosphate transport system substrate-binding protein